MIDMHTTAADAAVVCLRVLRRLLQDEESTLEQLTYVLENVHDPLAEACLPPSQRPLVTTRTPLEATTAAAAGRRQAPQPALSGARTEEATASSGPPGTAGRTDKAAGPLHKGGSGSSSSAAATAAAAAGSKKKKGGTTATTAPAPSPTRVPLTFSQYWGLFANLPTLCMVHRTVVQQLDTVVHRLAYLVEELHATPGSAGDPMGGVREGPGNPPHLSAAFLAVHKHVPAMRHATSAVTGAATAAAGPRGVFNELGAMVCELFGSELMKQYMAEHMMYTIKYTQRTAPLLLRLSRLWRWWCGAADLSVLSVADRDVVQRHALFLDFVWRTLGPSGVPADDRVQLPTPPEVRQARAAAGTPTTAAAAAPTAAGAGAVSGAGSPFVVAEVLGAAAGGGGNGGGGGARRQRVSSATGGGPSAPLPPIPATWEGFSTLVHLLATPLNTLRRYYHVARCLVESGALLAKDRDRLQCTFIDDAALRLSEEVNLVVEELCLQDVTSIMALMDMPSGTSGRNSGGANAGLVGGAHTGYTTAAEGATVSGAAPGSGGGAAAAAALSGAAGAPAGTGDNGNRALIHYGRLIKRFGRGRHERLAFLFSDWMCYVEECSNGRFRVRGTIPLPGLRVVQVRDDPSLDTVNCFELVSPSVSKRLIFYAATPEQRDQWIDAVRHTVRHFVDHQHQKQQEQRQAAVNHSNNSNAALHLTGVMAPAVTAAEDGDMAGVMRDTAPMLPPNSRLSRQHRNDGAWQEHVDLQRRLTEMASLAAHATPAAATSGTAAGMSMPSLGGASISLSGGSGVGAAGGAGLLSSSSAGHLPPPPASLPSTDPSHDGSFAAQRSVNAHRQLDYDVTPWLQQASMHRRIRSQDLIAAHHQQQQQQELDVAGSSSSSRSATPPRSAEGRVCVPGTRSGSEMDGDLDAPQPLQRPFGPTASSSLSVHHHHHQQPLSLINGRRASGLVFRSFNLDSMASGSRGTGGAAGAGTPLRRPVSERFDAVNMNGSTAAPLPLSQPQRTRSTSLRNSVAATTRGGSSEMPPTPSQEKVGAPTGAESTSGRACHVPPLSPGVPHTGNEDGGSRVGLENSSSTEDADDASEPVHDEDKVLASPSPSPRDDGRGAVGRESERGSSSSSHDSGVLDSIINEPVDASASPAPLPQQQEQQQQQQDQLDSSQFAGTGGGVVPTLRVSTSAAAAAEEAEAEAPSAAAEATMISVSAEEGPDAGATEGNPSVASPHHQPEPSVSVSVMVDEDEATTVSGIVTAFEPSAVRHGRLMSAFSPPISPRAVGGAGSTGNTATPSPLPEQQVFPATAAVMAALSDSPTDFDTDLQRMIEVAETSSPVDDVLANTQHVDPLPGIPEEGGAETQ